MKSNNPSVYLKNLSKEEEQVKFQHKQNKINKIRGNINEIKNRK